MTNEKEIGLNFLVFVCHLQQSSGSSPAVHEEFHCVNDSLLADTIIVVLTVVVVKEILLLFL